jgi:hypothetical protein
MNKLWKRSLIALVISIAVWITTQDIGLGAAVLAVLMVASISPIYLKYARDNPQHLWFKRKLFGWGWTPVTWQGWTVIGVYVLLVLLLALTLDDQSPTREVAFTFVIPVAILTSLLIRIAYKKGEKPRWQWGKEIDKYE